jgi:hypothetical protein
MEYVENWRTKNTQAAIACRSEYYGYDMSANRESRIYDHTHIATNPRPFCVLARLYLEPGGGWQEFLGCSDEKEVVR